MRNALVLIGAVVLVAAVFVGWRVSQQTVEVDIAPPEAATVAEAQAPPLVSVEATPVQPDTEAPAEAQAELPPVEPPAESWAPDPDAVSALRQSRLEGDPRAPPIARPEPGREREMPTAEELADPDLYLEYEIRQEQKVYASFVQASTKKIADLKALIERGRNEGVPPEQLAEGEEKLRRLEEMRAKLIAENPDIQVPEEQAPDGSDGNPASTEQTP